MVLDDHHHVNVHRHRHVAHCHPAQIHYSPRSDDVYGFALCVCVSVRVPETDNFITTSHFAFTWGARGLYPFRHVHLSVCPSGPGCLSGAFCPFCGLRSTPNHFQTLRGHADKKAYPYSPPTHTPSPLAAPGCAIQL